MLKRYICFLLVSTALICLLGFLQSIAQVSEDDLTKPMSLPEKVSDEPETKTEEKLTEKTEPEDSSEKQEEGQTEIEEVVQPVFPIVPRRFGFDFFIGARNRILSIERAFATKSKEVISSSEVKDAISGFVGPLDMMGANVAATVPSKYILGPGDTITVYTWSQMSELQTISLAVDSEGKVIIPTAGMLVVRGMTLAQFQDAAQGMLERVTYKGLKLVAALDKLRSIQIFITGEVFRPGSYAISAVATLFNALYLCGGPGDYGSLRNIKLLRNNETITVDFYKFLMDGDSSQDFSLEGGDTIFIPQVGRLAAISGEVRRPTEYELKDSENLMELLSLAGGIRPSGFLQRIQIDSVEPGKERILVDVDLSGEKRPEVPVFDGDMVTVFSIPSDRMNTVTVEGQIKMPGTYQLKSGMTVTDLVLAAQWVPGEAYMERADLFRLNPDKKTTKLIPIDLSKALSGDSVNNVKLEQWDKLVIYSKWDIQWLAERIVKIQGAVQKPGSYARSDGMTLGDLLIQAGGALPNAYHDRAFLLRLNEKLETAISIPVSLKGSDNKTELKDGDVLLVYTHDEAEWKPKREVTIEGAVQKPNVYARVDGMKVSELIQMAGGLTPDAYLDRSLLLRMDERQRITQGFFISPKLALQNDPKNNLELRDGDKFKVYTYQEAKWESRREVIITGAIKNPGVYERVDGMMVLDLVQRAGGTLPNAYLERVNVQRFRPDHETYVVIPVNLSKVLSGDKDANILLQDEDMITVYTLREADYKPKNIVTIYGAVQRPDIYTRTEGMRFSDLLFISGGALKGTHEVAELARVADNGEILIKTVDIKALGAGDLSQDILLENEDVISVRRQGEFPEAMPTVTIGGEVKYPGSYVLKRNERLGDLIKRAGGLTDNAHPEASIIRRNIDYMILSEQKKDIDQVKKVIEDLNQRQYQREAARSLLTEQKREKTEEANTKENSSEIPLLGASGLSETDETSFALSIPGQIQSAVSSVENITELQYTLVTPARKISTLAPSDRLVLDLRKAIDTPGSVNDIILKDGDDIMIPPKPDSISVTGAVFKQLAHVYVKDMKINDYIRMAGGYSIDADKESVYVVKAEGVVVKGEKTKLSPGDVIVVPTKVMVEKVADRWGQVIGVIRFVAITLATVYTIKLIFQ